MPPSPPFPPFAVLPVIRSFGERQVSCGQIDRAALAGPALAAGAARAAGDGSTEEARPRPCAPWAALLSIATFDIVTMPPSISTPPPTPDPVGSSSPPVSVAFPPAIVRFCEQYRQVVHLLRIKPDDVEIAAGTVGGDDRFPLAHSEYLDRLVRHVVLFRSRIWP